MEHLKERLQKILKTLKGSFNSIFLNHKNYLKFFCISSSTLLCTPPCCRNYSLWRVSGVEELCASTKKIIVGAWESQKTPFKGMAGLSKAPFLFTPQTNASHSQECGQSIPPILTCNFHTRLQVTAH